MNFLSDLVLLSAIAGIETIASLARYAAVVRMVWIVILMAMWTYRTVTTMHVTTALIGPWM